MSWAKARQSKKPKEPKTPIVIGDFAGGKERDPDSPLSVMFREFVGYVVEKKGDQVTIESESGERKSFNRHCVNWLPSADHIAKETARIRAGFICRERRPR